MRKLMHMAILAGAGWLLSGIAGAQLSPDTHHMSVDCGNAPGSYSGAEYAKAIAEASRGATADGGDWGSQAAAKLSACNVQRLMNDPSQAKTCADFEALYNHVTPTVVALLKAGIKVSGVVSAQLGKPAIRCAKELLSTCLNPRKTSEIDRLLALLKKLQVVGTPVTSSDGGMTFIFSNEGLVPAEQLRLCTKTELKCKKPTASCQARIDALKKALNDWYQTEDVDP